MNHPKNWLILRGLIREQRHWGRFKTDFATAFPDSKIFCLDHCGIGTEVDRVCPWTMDEMVDDMRARWMKLRDANPGSWGILAISLGGMVAMNWVSRFEGDFEHAVLGNSSVKPLNKFYDRFSMRMAMNFPSFFFHPSKVNRERVILSMTTNLSSKEIEAKAQEQAKISLNLKKFRETAIRQLTAAGNFAIPGNLRGMGKKKKILVIVSKGDRLVNPHCSEQIANYIDTPMMVHPTGNHDLSIDVPEWMAKSVREWCDSAQV